MKSIKKLLVILDPENDSDNIVQRAQLIARQYNASVFLFMCKPNALTPEAAAAVTSAGAKGISSLFFRKQQKLFVEHYEKMLKVLRGEFAAMKINVRAEFSADKDECEAILSRILEYKPDITLKSIQKPNALKSILITNTDWHLIKCSPYPLLLVKSHEWLEDGSIIAAVDPLHVKAQQNQLDHLLLDTAAAMASKLNLTAKVFHSYLPDLGALFPKILDADDYIREVKRVHREKVEELSAEHGIASEQIIMVRGDLIRSLLKCIRKEKGNIMVLGALSRNVVERAIVGSTAERILYDTPCDVLIMKNTQPAH